MACTFSVGVVGRCSRISIVTISHDEDIGVEKGRIEVRADDCSVRLICANAVNYGV